MDINVLVLLHPDDGERKNGHNSTCTLMYILMTGRERMDMIVLVHPDDGKRKKWT